MTKSRDEIIMSMCHTMRHDYGLSKDTDDVFSVGMTDSERIALWLQMSQIFDNDIAPYMEFKNE